MLICPAGAVAGAARSIMWAPIGAVPPIPRVMPISASVTLTTWPGKDFGAAQVKREWWYPDPPPIIAGPFD